MMTGIFLISKGLDIHRQVKINDKTVRFQNFCSCDFKTVVWRQGGNVISG